MSEAKLPKTIFAPASNQLYRDMAVTLGFDGGQLCEFRLHPGLTREMAEQFAEELAATWNNTKSDGSGLAGWLTEARKRVSDLQTMFKEMAKDEAACTCGADGNTGGIECYIHDGWGMVDKLVTALQSPLGPAGLLAIATQAHRMFFGTSGHQEPEDVAELKRLLDACGIDSDRNEHSAPLPTPVSVGEREWPDGEEPDYQKPLAPCAVCGRPLFASKTWPHLNAVHETRYEVCAAAHHPRWDPPIHVARLKAEGLVKTAWNPMESAPVGKDVILLIERPWLRGTDSTSQFYQKVAFADCGLQATEIKCGWQPTLPLPASALETT
jgi:hypothetical protein